MEYGHNGQYDRKVADITQKSICELPEKVPSKQN